METFLFRKKTSGVRLQGINNILIAAGKGLNRKRKKKKKGTRKEQEKRKEKREGIILHDVDTVLLQMEICLHPGCFAFEYADLNHMDFFPAAR